MFNYYNGNKLYFFEQTFCSAHRFKKKKDSIVFLFVFLKLSAIFAKRIAINYLPFNLRWAVKGATM
jgi:hypothetical protein